MARYIDADALIEMLNNKAKTDLEMGLYNHGALTQSFIKFVERQPTADVAPKSKVAINVMQDIAMRCTPKKFNDKCIEIGYVMAMNDVLALMNEQVKKYKENK